MPLSWRMEEEDMQIEVEIDDQESKHHEPLRLDLKGWGLRGNQGGLLGEYAPHMRVKADE